MEYRVRWEIYIDAETPEAAAMQALLIQRDPESLAVFFDVFDDRGECIEEDLSGDPPPAWDRSGCGEKVCTCHDETITAYFCRGCGCQPR